MRMIIDEITTARKQDPSIFAITGKTTLALLDT
jgi:hypothetical protein